MFHRYIRKNKNYSELLVDEKILGKISIMENRIWYIFILFMNPRKMSSI